MAPKGPYKFDADRRAKYLNLLRNGIGRRMAAAGVGLHHTTILAYRKRYPQFDREISEAESFADERVVNALFQAALKGNVAACCSWLYSRCPDEWRDRRSPAIVLPGEVSPTVDDGAVRRITAERDDFFVKLLGEPPIDVAFREGRKSSGNGCDSQDGDPTSH